MRPGFEENKLDQALTIFYGHPQIVRILAIVTESVIVGGIVSSTFSLHKEDIALWVINGVSLLLLLWFHHSNINKSPMAISIKEDRVSLYWLWKYRDISIHDILSVEIITVRPSILWGGREYRRITYNIEEKNQFFTIVSAYQNYDSLAQILSDAADKWKPKY
ncbi:MAG: hypothetical protein NT018_04990 [Armatimonadetes bacterium]|nr:hypothetical protein [Armatimonadota bacterium]